MLQKLFRNNRQARAQEHREILLRRADAIMKLDRPATQRELDEFSMICDQLGVRADKVPVASDIRRASMA